MQCFTSPAFEWCVIAPPEHWQNCIDEDAFFCSHLPAKNQLVNPAVQGIPYETIFKLQIQFRALFLFYFFTLKSKKWKRKQNPRTPFL